MQAPIKQPTARFPLTRLYTIHPKLYNLHKRSGARRLRFEVSVSRGSGNVNYGSNHWFFHEWKCIVLRRFLWIALCLRKRITPPSLQPAARRRKFQSRWSNFNIICVLAPPQRNGSEAVCAVKCVCVWIIIIIYSRHFFTRAALNCCLTAKMILISPALAV